MATEAGYGTTKKSQGGSEDKDFVDRAWEAQHRFEKRMARVGSGRYARVLKMARKPEPEEFRRTSLIVGIGLLVIGAVGFAIFLLMELLNKALGVK
ncbi:MAG: protein translocase SEC61 complex subunit gamma [Euryarchaeota archaeon]|nr:protein translocase SEC61 complex subunit gamma [Euryarchaeota archaeon]